MKSQLKIELITKVEVEYGDMLIGDYLAEVLKSLVPVTLVGVEDGVATYEGDLADLEEAQEFAEGRLFAMTSDCYEAGDLVALCKTNIVVFEVSGEIVTE